MKRIYLALWLAGLAFGALAQQQERITVTKVKKGNEPKEVMSALKADFPDAVTKNLSFLPAKLYGEEWNVRLEGDDLIRASFYQVDIKEGNRNYTAVYDEKGKLLSSKQLIHDAELPEALMKTLARFDGWHVDETHELIKYNGKKSSDIYRVKLQKGVEHKIVYLDLMGNIVNTRFTVF